MNIEVKPAACAHCQQPARGYATVGPDRLCRPDLSQMAMECYRLVTVYGHLMPCGDCISGAAVRYGPAPETIQAAKNSATELH